MKRMRKPAYLIAGQLSVTPDDNVPTLQGWWRLTQPSSLLLYPGLRVLDFICGPIVLILVLMATNSHRMPGGMASFLSIRITVKNLAMLSAFVTIWWLVF